MSFGAVGGAIAGGIASAGASTLIGSMFGGEDDVESAYAPQVSALSVLGAEAGETARATTDWAQAGWGDLDAETAEILGRLEPVAAEQTALATTVADMPQWLQDQGAALAEAGTALTGYGVEAIDRHRDVYQPLEQEWIQDYRDFTSGARADQEAARAGSTVAQAFEASRENAMRQLEGYGIDPSQMRSGALDLNIRLQQAATQAQAMTDARRYVDEQGRQMRADILQYGSQYPTWGQQYSQLGMAGQEAGAQVGQGAVESAQGISDIYGDIARTNLSQVDALSNMYRTGTAMMGAAAPYYSAGSGAWGSAGTVTGQQQAGIAGQQARYDPLGQNIGTAIGDATATYFNTEGGSVPNMSGGTAPLGQSNPTYASGNPFGYALGGEIEGPGGPYSDSVPIQASDGEYMIPYEVVHRKGTEFFDKLVDKTRQELQAIPT